MAISDEEFAAAWSRMTLAQVAERCGESAEKVRYRARKAGLPCRRDLEYEPDSYIPTQQEIRLACWEFQKNWTEQERATRAVGNCDSALGRWVVPHVESPSASEAPAFSKNQLYG